MECGKMVNGRTEYGTMVNGETVFGRMVSGLKVRGKQAPFMIKNKKRNYPHLVDLLRLKNPEV